MIKNIVLKLIEVYRAYMSPLWGHHCRFYPSCSRYFKEAVSLYGLRKGMLKGLFRISRCHPFSLGGFDPVAK